MEHISKSFTVVDFLGFLLPGAAAVLAYQYYYGGLTTPFESFFGPGSPLLSVYFVALSYLIGTLLHEASGILGRRLWNESLHEKHWKDAAVANVYRKVFQKEPPGENSKKAEAGREISQYVQMTSQSEKIRLFSAFSAMSRTLLLTLVLILLLTFLQDWRTGLHLLLPSLIAGLILLSNWKHYLEQRVEYIYTAFLTMSDKQDFASAGKEHP